MTDIKRLERRPAAERRAYFEGYRAALRECRRRLGDHVEWLDELIGGSDVWLMHEIEHHDDQDGD